MDAAVEEIIHAAEALDGASPVDEATEMALADGRATLQLQPGGFAIVHEGTMSLAVHPERRGRGIGGALARAAMAQGPTSAWSHGNHPAAERIAARYGWERARDLWVMRRPTADRLPDLALPPGVRVRGYADADVDALLEVNAAAFADHPEQGAMDADNLARRMAEPWFDPAGLLIAEDEHGILGFHWTKQHSPALGEVYVVGVAPPAQGRGLGKVLTLAGLHHLAGLGVSEVLLYVEAENAPAVAVYSRLGFSHAEVDTHVQYRRP